jgi:hypothetical protein
MSRQRPHLRRHLLIGGLLALLVAACAIQDIRQLDRFKKLADAGHDAAIVEETVTCEADDMGCDQLRLIRGMACYREAKNGVMPKLRYQCAIDELTLGLRLALQGDVNQADTRPYREALLESLRERHDLAANFAEATPYMALLRQQSDAFRHTFPKALAGYYYGATALLAEATQRLVQDSSRRQACQLLSAADALIATGRPHAGALTENFEQTGKAIRRTHRQECTP